MSRRNAPSREGTPATEQILRRASQKDVTDAGPLRSSLLAATDGVRVDVLDARLAVGAIAAWTATFAALNLSSDTVLHAAFGAVGIAFAALLFDRLSRPAWMVTARSHPEPEPGSVSDSDSDSDSDPEPDSDSDSDSDSRLVPVPTGPRWRRGGAAVALAAFCCFGPLLSLSVHLARIRSGPIHELVERRSAGVFEVTATGDPRPILSTQSFGASRVALDATLTHVRSGPLRYRMSVPVVVLASADTWSSIIPGERLRLDGRLGAPPPGQFLGGSLAARGPPVKVGDAPWRQRQAAVIRRGLQNAASVLPASERGLLPGLVDGDTSGLDPQLAQAFRTAGLTHLVAVSGTNLAILIGAVLLVLRRIRTPPWACAVIGGAVLVAFVIVARASPSVVRAGVMAAVLLFALATGRPRQGLPSLALAVLVLLMWHPDWANNAGFAMSALATASLFLLAPGWADALRRRHLPPLLAEGLAVSAAATLVSAPIIVLLSGRVSLVALPANILAEFAVAPATVLGVLAAIAAPWSPFLGHAFARAAGVPCRWLVADAQWFSALPGATVSWPASVGGAAGLVGITVIALVLLRFPATRRPVVAALLTVVVIEIPGRAVFGGWAPASTIMVACDVGQGDGIVLPLGHHAGVVMDSGPEPMAIDRCLHSLGITSVPLYIQSHFDLDHVGGVAGVADGRRIGRVLTGPLQAPPLGRGILTKTLAPLGITSQIVPAGTDVEVGPVRLHVLESHIVDVDGEPDSNNSSLMIRASVAGRTILLTGDASTEAQQALMASGQSVAADVLKVPHHGSAYFDPEFLAAVHAKLAVISVGLHNSYGHPAPSLLRALAELHVPVRRTDLDGDVAVLVSRGRLEVVRHEPSARLAADGAGPVRTGTGPIRSGTQHVFSATEPVRSVTQPGEPSGPGPGRHETGLTAGVVAPSVRRATMKPWPVTRAERAVTAPTTASSWWSATRNSWSAGPSSRSPPRLAAPIRTQN